MAQHDIAAILDRYAASGRSPGPTRDEAALWDAVTSGTGRVGAAHVRDSARRTWLVEARRDARRGRFVVVRPVRGDNEPFRASADGYRPEAYLPISASDWTLLALLVCGRDGDEGTADEELRHAAFVVVDRMVVEAQHRGLMGAAEDEDDED